MKIHILKVEGPILPSRPIPGCIKEDRTNKPASLPSLRRMRQASNSLRARDAEQSNELTNGGKKRLQHA